MAGMVAEIAWRKAPELLASTNNNGSRIGCRCSETIRHVSNQFSDQLAGFLLLTIVTFSDDFIEDVASTFGVTHIDIGACKIELGRGFIGTGEEVEVVIAVHA